MRINYIKLILFVFFFIQMLPIGENIFDINKGLYAESNIYRTILWLFIYICAFIILFNDGIRKYLKLMTRKYFPLICLLFIPLLNNVNEYNYLKVFVFVAHGFGVIVLSLVTVKFFGEDIYGLIRVVAFALTLNLCVQLIAVIMYPEIGIVLQGRWTGLSPNPNHLGMLAYVNSFLSIILLLRCNKFKMYLYVICFIVSIVVVVGTQSITSLICLLLSVVLVLGVRYTGVYYFMKDKSIWFVLIVGFVLFELYPIVAPYFELYLNRSPDMSGRFDIFDKGMEVVARRPLIGWGYDNYYNLNEFYKQEILGFGNGYISLLVKGGVISGLLFLWLIYIYANALRFIDKDVYMLTFVFLMTMLAYNVSEMTIYSGNNVMWTLFCVFLIYLRTNVINMRYNI